VRVCKKGSPYKEVYLLPKAMPPPTQQWVVELARVRVTSGIDVLAYANHLAVEELSLHVAPVIIDELAEAPAATQVLAHPARLLLDDEPPGLVHEVTHDLAVGLVGERAVLRCPLGRRRVEERR